MMTNIGTCYKSCGPYILYPILCTIKVMEHVRLMLMKLITNLSTYSSLLYDYDFKNVFVLVLKLTQQPLK